MSILETLGPFWTIGIVVNVTLTALAVYWVVRQMRPRPPRPAHAEDAKPQAPGSPPSR